MQNLSALDKGFVNGGGFRQKEARSSQPFPCENAFNTEGTDIPRYPKIPGPLPPDTCSLSPTYLSRIRERNSSRVCTFSRNAPSIALVTVCDCSPSRRRASPCTGGALRPQLPIRPAEQFPSWMALAIWLVSRSLNLQTPREHVHKPRNLDRPDNFFIRDIGDMALPGKMGAGDARTGL